MKIAIIGATGFIGKGILAESLNRGHEVTAIVREPQKLSAHPKLTRKQGEVTNLQELTSQLPAHDVVISAFNPGKDSTGKGAEAILQATRESKVPRLLVVGGAGTLETEPGKRVVDQPNFPSEWKDGALKTAAFLELLRKEQEVDWVFLSPPAMIAPGERTGAFRLGKDQLLIDEHGQSKISIEDYAVAMLDEVEKPLHSRTRFTVAY